MAEPSSNARTAASVHLTDPDRGLRSVQDEVLAAAAALGYPDASAFAIRLVIEEAVTNAFRHGNNGDHAKGVDVEWNVGRDRIEIAVEDRGEGFDPSDVPDPTTDDRLTVPTGRGLLLIRAYMSDVRFNERGNRIIMVYDRPA